MSKMQDGVEQDLFGDPEERIVDTETPELPLEPPPPRVVKLTSAKRSPSPAAVVAPPVISPAAPPEPAPSVASPPPPPPPVAEATVPEPVKKPVRLQSSRKGPAAAPAAPVESAPPAEPEIFAGPKVAAAAPPPLLPSPPVEAVSPPVAASAKVEMPAATAAPPPTVASPPAEVAAFPAKAVAPAKSASTETSAPASRQHPRPMRLTGHGGHPPTRGHLLQEARVRCDLSFEQVALATKIKKQFIEALELDDADRLPPDVYVKAYVRRLCHHYGLDEDEVFALAVAPPPKPVDKGIPNEILQHIEEGKQVNPKEEKKIRNLTWGAVAAGLLILAGVGTFWGVWTWRQDRRGAVPDITETSPVLIPATEDAAAAAAEIALELERCSPPGPALVLSELPLPGANN